MPLVPTKPPVRDAWGDQAPSGAIADPDVSTPGYVAAGWPLSQQPPARQYWNWFMNYVMNGVRYLSRAGIAQWDPQETYQYGDVVNYTQSGSPVLFQSVTNAGNINQSPLLAGNVLNYAYWGFLTGYQPSGSLYPASTLQVVNNGNQWVVPSARFNAGYRTNVDGSVEQWGVAVAGAAGTFIAYPQVFQNAALNVQATPYGNNGAIELGIWTKSGFPASNTTGGNISWRAIGY